MKLTEIKVPCTSKKELKIIKGIVRVFRPYTVTDENAYWFKGCKYIVFDEEFLSVTIPSIDRTEITFRQLIDLLIEESKQPEKIAVMVENETERDLVSKFLKPVFNYGFDKYPAYIMTDQQGFWSNKERTRKFGYKIIPFSDFAKQHNIRVPLLTSEDGVELFEGDEYYYVWKQNGKGFELLRDNTYKLEINNIKDFKHENNKAFHSKENAFKWIEEQNKPKEVELKISNSSITAIITKDEVYNIDNLKCLEYSDIKEILKTMEELIND